MTVVELSQLYYLNKEIQIDQQRLEELRKGIIAGVPMTRSAKSVPEWYTAGIAELIKLIAAKRRRCVRERDRLERYIDGIEDSLTRMIFTLRFVKGLSWLQTSFQIGGANSDVNIRQICYRHLKKTDSEGRRG